MATSFKTDIAPMFAPFRANMMWRFDLTNYDTVKTNAALIYGHIAASLMPPAPMPPLSQAQTELFAQGLQDGFPP